jgi:mRNA interferase RelE/StbE
MGRFEVRFRPSVRKDLRGIPGADVRRILDRIRELSVDPRPIDCKKLTGRDLYRIRSGAYRVVYEIHDREVVVVVVKVGHRRDVYGR